MKARKRRSVLVKTLRRIGQDTEVFFRECLSEEKASLRHPKYDISTVAPPGMQFGYILFSQACFCLRTPIHIFFLECPPATYFRCNTKLIYCLSDYLVSTALKGL